jgi:phenylpropionate dioxygenase-like ring-hydroxylating dioxygenase large terminal subunit
MGEVFRRYWIPACLAEEIAEPGGTPLKVRLLGEDLVAFRDTSGQVGLLAELCAHRQASLTLGRNEEGGLRCIYHGWLYDVDGKILETPCESERSLIKHIVRLPAYPCHEVNGIIWTYMGPAEKMPLLPSTLWFTAPRDHIEVVKFKNECNYLQALEGDCDHPHVTYLHRRGEGLETPEDTSPSFEVDHTSWGVRAVTYRRMNGGTRKMVRTNLFAYPFIGLIGGFTGANAREQMQYIHPIYQVPADDYHTDRYDMIVDMVKPADGRYRAEYSHELNPDFTKVANKTNNYLQDRSLMFTSVYSGIPFGNHTQDAAVTESMGPIMDRSKEHLGESDGHIVAVRQGLFQAMETVQNGGDPPGVAFSADHNDYSDLYCISGPIPADAHWKQLLTV